MVPTVLSGLWVVGQNHLVRRRMAIGLRGCAASSTAKANRESTTKLLPALRKNSWLLGLREKFLSECSPLSHHASWCSHEGASESAAVASF